MLVRQVGLNKSTVYAKEETFDGVLNGILSTETVQSIKANIKTTQHIRLEMPFRARRATTDHACNPYCSAQVCEIVAVPRIDWCIPM